MNTDYEICEINKDLWLIQIKGKMFIATSQEELEKIVNPHPHLRRIK